MKEEILGAKFKKLREEINFTQKQIAQYLSVDQSIVSRFEKAERKMPVEIIEKSCDLFGCTLKEFLSEEDIELQGVSISFRADTLQESDIEAIVAMNRMANNILFMNKILEKKE